MRGSKALCFGIRLVFARTGGFCFCFGFCCSALRTTPDDLKLSLLRSKEGSAGAARASLRKKQQAAKPGPYECSSAQPYEE